MSSIGINFRATSGYVTDGAGETYCTGFDTYPTTRGGWTFGWESSTANGLDRNAGGDARLAGICYVLSNAPTFRLDLPATGSYNVRAALGDYASLQWAAWKFQDNSTVFATTTGYTAGGADHYKDPTDVERSSGADWITNNALVNRTFSSTILRLVADQPAAAVVIAHLYAEQVGGGGNRRRRVLLGRAA